MGIRATPSAWGHSIVTSMAATKFILISALCLVAWVSVASSHPERRGSCLSLCGTNGVQCPSGYSCQSNGCGHECYDTSFVQPQGCPPFTCDQHCPLGYKRD